MKPNNKDKKDSNKNGIKIIKIAAFCFALISWLATAQGLNKFIFREYYWQAVLISFGIQAILFVFNLKLPEYFKTIGEVVPKEQRKKRRFILKDTYKWVPVQKVIVFFYIITIFASSFFSFVYMTNFIYEDTRYLDANIALERNFRENITATEQYVEEDIKLHILMISDLLSELIDLNDSASTGGAERKTKEELKEALQQAEETYNSKKTTVNNLEDFVKDCQRAVDDLIGNQFEKYNEYKEASANLKDAREELNDAKDELTVAENNKTAAENALQNYKRPTNIIVYAMLTETLSPSQQLGANLKQDMTELINEVVNVGKNGEIPEKYRDIVTNIQQLSIIIDQYSLLNEIQENNTDKDDSLKTLKNVLINESVVIPEAKSPDLESEKELWENTWRERYRSLGTIVASLPEYTVNSNESNYSDVVNIDLLKNFNRNERAREIDDIARTNLYNINALERAWKLLFSDYSWLAWFSFILAVFFDISSLLVGLFIIQKEGKRIDYTYC